MPQEGLGSSQGLDICGQDVPQLVERGMFHLHDVVVCLRHSHNFGNQTRAALIFSEKALHLCLTKESELIYETKSTQQWREFTSMLCSCYLLVGTCCAKYAYEAVSFESRIKLQRKAISLLDKAASLSSVSAEGEPPLIRHQSSSTSSSAQGPQLQLDAVSNPIALYHLALVYADTRALDMALLIINKALRLRPTHALSWALRALILTGKKLVRYSWLVVLRTGTN